MYTSHIMFLVLVYAPTCMNPCTCYCLDSHHTNFPTYLCRSMTHRIETEPVTSSTVLPTPITSLPTPHPLRSHTHLLPNTATCNHTPNSSETHSQLLVFTSTSPNTSLSSSNGATSTESQILHTGRESTATNCKAGGHVPSHADHVMSHVGHMTLRRRDAQCTVPLATCVPVPFPQDSNRLIRPKIRHPVVTNGDCSPLAGQNFELPPSSRQEEPVLKTSGPARNLRYRPYTLGKT